jgi:hypothetical protein
VDPQLIIADLDFKGIVSQDEYFFEGPKIEPLLFEWLWILQIFIDYL